MKVLLLWLLPGLFLLRVLGQVYVGIYSPAWLPPWSEWYSGLLPYPLLLPSQILLLMWMAVISYDNTQRSGMFLVESSTVRIRLRWIAALYALVMLVRYVLTMKGVIPIVFHWVLAAYIATLTLRKPQRSA